MDTAAPPPLKTWKHQCEVDIAVSESPSVTGDCPSDTDGFSLVESGRGRSAREWGVFPELHHIH